MLRWGLSRYHRVVQSIFVTSIKRVGRKYSYVSENELRMLKLTSVPCWLPIQFGISLFWHTHEVIAGYRIYRLVRDYTVVVVVFFLNIWSVYKTAVFALKTAVSIHIHLFNIVKNILHGFAVNIF